MCASLRRHIEVELKQMRHLLAQYTPLIQAVNAETPDWRDSAALALMLHGFYTGVERVLSRIMKELGEATPEGATWHRDLLTLASTRSSLRPAILSSELATRLEGYLGFRHFIRNAYAYECDWEQMEGLVFQCAETLLWLERDIEALLGGLTGRE